jgi:regulatory protein
VKAERHKRPRPPLDSEALDRLSLFYVGRYATTAARLRYYLVRKLRERGWEGEGEPPIEAVVERAIRLGFVDDRAFAVARAEALQRRGFGDRRTAQALRAAGVGEENAQEARSSVEAGAWAAALRFAERKRIGPFAVDEADRPLKQKQFAALMRAGHSSDMARRLVEARPGEVPDHGDG